MNNETNERAALLPCPICGHATAPKIITASELMEEDMDFERVSDTNEDTYAVMCDASRPGGPGGCGASSGFKRTEAEAAASWNRRASAATQAEPVAYTDAIGEAGDQYHRRFPYAHPLPAQWRWQELWDAMQAAAPVVPPVALPALTDDEIFQCWIDAGGCNPRQSPKEFCSKFARAILAASAAPAPEQMQPNAQDKGHLALPLAGAPCGDKAVERDAARYRWLRDKGMRYANVGLGSDCDGGNVVDFSPTFTIPEPVGMSYEDNEWSLEDLDAAIDAALSAVPPTVKE